MKINLSKKIKAKNVTVTFYTSSKMKEILKRIAQENHVTISFLLNSVLEDLLKEELEK